MSKTLAFQLVIDGLNNEITRLAELQKELEDNKEMLKLFKKEGADFSGILAEQTKLKLEIKQVTKAINDATREFNKKSDAAKNELSRQRELAQQERKIKEQQSDMNRREAQRQRQLNAEARAQLRQEAADRKIITAQRKRDFQEAIRNQEVEKRSLIGMRAELERMKREYYELSEAQRNALGGRRLLQNIQNQSAQVSNIERSTGVFNRNVGNYPVFGQALGNIASNMSGGIVGAGMAAGMAAAGLAVVEMGKRIVTLNAEIDAIQANVRKTTGLNAEAVESLTQRLKDLDTNTTLQELLEISVIAGRFGVTGEKAVGDFTEAVNLLNIALGDEFGGGVDQITTEVAKLSNVLFGATSDGEIMSDRFLKLGNTLNVLANTSAATAGEITDISTRIGGMGRSLGFTQSQILGIAASISELGINVERGSGAFVRLNSVLRSNSADVAKAIGLTQQELAKMLDENPFETMNKVISELVGRHGKGTELITVMKDLRLSGVGMQEIFLKWAEGQEVVTKNVNNANEAIGNTNSLLSEQANMLDSLPAQWQRLKNAVSDLFVNSGIQSGMTGYVRYLGDMIALLSRGEIRAFFRNFMGGYNTQAGKNARDRVFSGANASDYDLHGQFGVGGSQGKDNPLFNSSFFATNQKKAEITTVTKSGKKAADEAKDRERRGEPGSLTFIKSQLSDIKTLMDRTSNAELLEGYARQANALTRQLEAAELRLKNLTDYAVKPMPSRSTGILETMEKHQEFLKKNPEFEKKVSEETGQRQGAAFSQLSQTIEDFRKRQQYEKEKQKSFEQEKQEIILDGAAQTADSLLNLWDSYYQKKRDREIAALNKEYEAKFEAVKGNATLEEALQRELAEKTEEIEKRAAKQAQNLAIIQANIAGALGMISAFKEGNPILGAIKSAFIAANTAAQIAIIKSQKFAEGGFTGDGYGMPDETGHKIAGVVHANEYVGSKDQVERYPALFRWLEKDRVDHLKGFAMGGFTTQAPAAALPDYLLTGGGGMTLEMARMVANETAAAVYRATITAAQESNRIAERENYVRQNIII